MIEIVLIEDNIQGKDLIYDLVKSKENLVILNSGKNCYDAITLVKKHRPDILLLDAALQINSKVENTSILKNHFPLSRTVLISTDVRDCLVWEIAQGTISNCLIKNLDQDRLDTILEEICTGKLYVNDKFNVRAYQLLADSLHIKKPGIDHEKKNIALRVKFSKSEIIILHHLAQGVCDKDIAKALNLATGSVRNLISSIRKKTGIKKTDLNPRVQLIQYIQEHGIAKSGGECLSWPSRRV